MSDIAGAAGGCLMVGLPGPDLDTDTRDRLSDLRPAGVILFGRNLDSPERLAELQRALGGLRQPPRLVALDQEGGRVSRLQPWIGPTPTAAELATRGSGATEGFAADTGRALGALGFNVDFAPVVDLCDVAATNGIGDRSYGVAPDVVVEHADAFLRGLTAAGVAGCLKHFPGLGDTPVDSHLSLPTCPRSVAALEAADLIPYRRLAARAPAVMIGHGHYTAWHPRPEPATGSRAIVADLLRGEIGFEGLVVTDDLEMGAVLPLDPDGSYAVRALEAGCDLLLYCADLDRADRAREAIVGRADADRAFADRLVDASTRVAGLARTFPIARPDLAVWSAARERLAASAPG